MKGRRDPTLIKILLGCESSGIVREEFKRLGFDAWSCDLKDSEIPGNHIKDDLIYIMRQGWDMMIAFPPCTHLAGSGAMHMEQKKEDGRQQKAIDFFMKCVNAPIRFKGIENPVGIMSTEYRKPDQIIHPYYFGDPFEKRTCLWLENLPLLYHNEAPNLFDQEITHVEPEERYTWTTKDGKTKSQPRWYALASQKNGERETVRSRTFPGIAKAMADQWSQVLINS